MIQFRNRSKSNRNALFVSRDLQPAVLNRAVHKQSLSNTVLITVWRLQLSHVIVQCPVMSQIRSYPEHVTFIYSVTIRNFNKKLAPWPYTPAGYQSGISLIFRKNSLELGPEKYFRLIMIRVTMNTGEKWFPGKLLKFLT